MSNSKGSSITAPMWQVSEPSEAEQAQIWAFTVAHFSNFRLAKHIGRCSSIIVALMKDPNADDQKRSPGR
ncbi:hypothetical protein Y032_0044g951 [Ancylostoma ceylanicum]|uniref:Uncharacterized protein n=1 Tax=Ancylostoma ceylanicum TaxID=53326 RepID=A0A016UFH4_9BILA|nr:hypothetical protein Y032_0044g951 [Ancylostoma ceylanicum]